MIARKIHIQHELNRIQHRCGYLPADELKALSARAAAMGEPTPLRRLHEVASFFPHYRLEKPNGLEVKVCRDMTCHLRGASRCRERLEELAKELGSGRLEVGGVSCLGQCDGAPAILIGDRPFRAKKVEGYEALVSKALVEKVVEGYEALVSKVVEGYEALVSKALVSKAVEEYEALVSKAVKAVEEYEALV